MKAVLEGFAAEVLAEHGVRATPMIDVDRLARRLRVEVREQRLDPGDYGHTTVRSGTVCVTLRASMPRGRRRFVLAHELGHVLIADPRSQAMQIRAEMRVDEERFCDRFAEALLLPAGWLRNRYGRSAQSLPALLECAKAAGVSPAAASIALVRAAGWDRTLLRLHSTGGRWQLLSVTGHLPAAPSAVHSTLELARALDALVDDDVPLRAVVVEVGGVLMTVPAQAAIRGNVALLLVDFQSRRKGVHRS